MEYRIAQAVDNLSKEQREYLERLRGKNFSEEEITNEKKRENRKEKNSFSIPRPKSIRKVISRPRIVTAKLLDEVFEKRFGYDRRPK